MRLSLRNGAEEESEQNLVGRGRAAAEARASWALCLWPQEHKGRKVQEHAEKYRSTEEIEQRRPH